MTTWLTVIGSVAAAVVLILRWQLSPGQKAKRNKKNERKKLEKMRKNIANMDGDAIHDDLHDLRL